MRVGVLFSGGKDSTYALHLAMRKEEVACLITVASKNPESYMFHTPNISVAQLQAEALGLQFVKKSTKGVKEEELSDLEEAIVAAVSAHRIEGVVTGAIESVYQAERVQRICDRLGLWCYNPLWKMDQEALLCTLVDGGFKVIVSGIFAYPLDEGMLGRELDSGLVDELVGLRDKYGISPSGEGGEIETTVLDAPIFKKRVVVDEARKEARGNSGVYRIVKAHLAGK
jgi:diphthine-ammonia ligase